PAPLRIPDGLSGINRLANLIMWGSVKFPTSCYSVSWKMLTEVDYWDEEVIPEDWHVFLKCCFTLGDRVHVEAMFLPLGNDCVLTTGYFKTLKAHYAQSVRHAWGASDIPYALRAARSSDSPLSRKRKFLLSGAVTKVHAMWMAQWYLITLGVFIPAKLAGSFGAPMPYWWTHRYPVPGPGWHPENVATVQGWLSLGKTGIIEPTMWLNLPGLLIAICIVPLIIMIGIEMKTRPARPEYVSRKAYVWQFVMWPLMAPITFFFASLPALSAQWKLASGQGLIYRVAEKGSRKRTGPVLAFEPLDPANDPIGAVGGR
ncbi:MAG: glycosyltransferase family 2 protein, partial [Tepidiformaceae bacterium]